MDTSPSSCPPCGRSIFMPPDQACKWDEPRFTVIPLPRTNRPQTKNQTTENHNRKSNQLFSGSDYYPRKNPLSGISPRDESRSVTSGRPRCLTPVGPFPRAQETIFPLDFSETAFWVLNAPLSDHTRISVLQFRFVVLHWKKQWIFRI